MMTLLRGDFYMKDFWGILGVLGVGFIIFSFIYNFADVLKHLNPLFAVSVTLGTIGFWIFAIAPKNNDKHPLSVTSYILLLLSIIFFLIDVFSK